MTTSENPYAASSVEQVPGDSHKPPQERQQLLGPAIGILVTSILHIAGGLSYFVFVFSVYSRPDADARGSNVLVISAMYYSISMLYCLLLISGAFSMMRQGSYMWAMTVCILAVIPFLGPCYFFAVPFGIWGLIVLRRPDVRESFAAP
jgi:hypothetical protein